MDRIGRAIEKRMDNRQISLPPLRWVLLGICLVIIYSIIRRVGFPKKETIEKLAQLPNADKTEVSEQ